MGRVWSGDPYLAAMCNLFFLMGFAPRKNAEAAPIATPPDSTTRGIY
jgi:hypothetical protein